MKLKSEKLCMFRDISRSRIPCTMLKSADHDGFKIILTVELFSSDMTSSQYVLFYHDDETAIDDYRRLLRFFKKMQGK